MDVLGWREWAALPGLGISRIKAKLDTGARTASLHAIEVEPFRRDEETWVRFGVHPVQRETTETIPCEAPLLGYRWVRDSGGTQTLRPVIETTVAVADRAWPIEVTLASRDAMGFRLLLGRRSIKGRFVVDPARSYLAERVCPGILTDASAWQADMSEA